MASVVLCSFLKSFTQADVEKADAGSGHWLEHRLEHVGWEVGQMILAQVYIGSAVQPLLSTGISSSCETDGVIAKLCMEAEMLVSKPTDHSIHVTNHKGKGGSLIQAMKLKEHITRFNVIVSVIGIDLQT